jgi:hypothetical protein
MKLILLFSATMTLCPIAPMLQAPGKDSTFYQKQIIRFSLIFLLQFGISKNKFFFLFFD